MSSLNRFCLAQDDRNAGYSLALKELRSGRKQSHWIWFVFPQLKGLGNSSQADFYGLLDLDEACSYLRNPLLGERYREISTVLEGKLHHQVALAKLMGSSLDAQKVISSITLFHAAAKNAKAQDVSTLCEKILKAAAAQSFPACRYTLRQMNRPGN